MEDKFIDQIAVIGDGRSLLYIVPDYKVLEGYAADQGIEYNNIQDLMNNNQVHDFIRSYRASAISVH